MARKTSPVTCKGCNNEFLKENRYIRAAEKHNRPHFCSQSCQASYRNKAGEFGGKNNLWTSEHNGNAYKPKANPFRFFLRKAKGRGKLGDLSLKYLEDLWSEQDGLCPYSGIKMTLERNQSIFKMASLDRIDSSKLYEEGNVQFIVTSLNLAKQGEDDKSFRAFIQQLAQ